MSDQLPHIGGDFWRGWPQRRILNADAVDQKTPFTMEAGPTSASAVALFHISISNIDRRYSDIFEKYRYRYRYGNF